jgi:hypothetical protein
MYKPKKYHDLQKTIKDEIVPETWNVYQLSTNNYQLPTINHTKQFETI